MTGMDERQITLGFEDAQRIFDLAVAADTACSGWMDSDDVRSMRSLATALGVDPAVCTGEEFITQYPHAFSADLSGHRQRVPGRNHDHGILNDIVTHRPETDEEVIARLGGDPTDGQCIAGRWKGRCGKAADHPIHQGTTHA